ncbi:MAG: hypothetical protein J6R67_01915 [Treponema sp.]|nr:hypothetical protein [Treponema sp.]
MKYIQVILKKVLFLLLVFLVLSCENSSSFGNNDAENIDEILTIYSFELNIDLIAGAESGIYHKVTEYNCTSLGDSYYDVKSYKVHWLSNNNSAYKNKTGNQLIEMVKTGSLTPSKSEKSIRTSNGSSKGIVNSDTNEEAIFYLPTKAKYESLKYF